jgi:hypothetical protein
MGEVRLNEVKLPRYSVPNKVTHSTPARRAVRGETLLARRAQNKTKLASRTLGIWGVSIL